MVRWRNPGRTQGQQRLHMLLLESFVNRQIDGRRQPDVRDHRHLPNRYVHLADELPELAGLHNRDAVDDVASAQAPFIST